MHDIDESADAAQIAPSQRLARPFDLEAEHARAAVQRGLFGDTVAVKIDRFIVLEVLGQGGMGTVYLCYDPSLDRKVAVKLVRVSEADGDHQRRLLREAQAMAQLSHPNVVTVHDVGVRDGQVFIAMEWIRGTTLRHWCHDAERPPKAVLEAFICAGEGLHAAHRVGLVHRDFKLDNVMVSDEGAVKVLDFGLARLGPTFTTEPPVGSPARATAVHEDARSGDTKLLAQTLTQRAGLVGTLLYMAPEQLAQKPATARSDQFSFCVALYLALHGYHPFEGDTPLSVAEAIAAGTLRRGRGMNARRVPRWIDKVLERGFSHDPERRYPTMRALLDDLRRDQTRRRRVLFATVAAAGVATTFVYGGGMLSDSTPSPCEVGARQLDTLWNDAQRSRLQQAFEQTGGRAAAVTWEKVSEHLEAFEHSWVEHYRSACEATHVRGEQSGELLDRRMQCLDQRKRELEAYIRVLATPTETVLQNAASGARGLAEPLTHCSDRVALLAEVPPPAVPAIAARVRDSEQVLAEAFALKLSGQYGEALAALEPRMTDALATDFAPLRARFSYALGSLHERTGRYETASDHLEQALLTAIEARDDEVAGDAASWLVYVDGYHLKHHERSQRWADLAEAFFNRLGERGEARRATLLHHRGSVLASQGEYEAALEAHRLSLSLHEQTSGPDTEPVANALNSIASVQLRLGQYPQARTNLERALEIRRAALGPDHPLVASTLTNLGVVLQELAAYDLALQAYREALAIKTAVGGPRSAAAASTLFNIGKLEYLRGQAAAGRPALEEALSIWEERYGPEHPNVAAALLTLANIDVELEELGRAEAGYVRAAEIMRAVHGEDHPDTAAVLGSHAQLLALQERFDEARPLFDQVLKIMRNRLGPDHPNVGLAHHNLGELEFDQERYRAAIVHYQRALEVFREDSPELAMALTGLGESQLHARKVEDAIISLERAYALHQSLGETPQTARTEFALARALWTGKRDRIRAQELATRAAQRYAERGRNDDEQHVRRWLNETF